MISGVGSIGELLGTIATIATLIYLAVQIRMSYSLSRRQALDHGVDRLSEWGGCFVDSTLGGSHLKFRRHNNE